MDLLRIVLRRLFHILILLWDVLPTRICEDDLADSPLQRQLRQDFLGRLPLESWRTSGNMIHTYNHEFQRFEDFMHCETQNVQADMFLYIIVELPMCTVQSKSSTRCLPSSTDIPHVSSIVGIMCLDLICPHLWWPLSGTP